MLSISGHELLFHLHPEPGSGVPLLAAAVVKLPTRTGAVRSAALAVRFQAQQIPGYEISFQLWPIDGRGDSGSSIQFPAGRLDGPIHFVITRPGLGEEVGGSAQRFRGWHTALTEWTQGSARFFLDGRQVGLVTSGVPARPMNWVLEVDGVPRSAARPGSGIIRVAWVSAYVPAPRGT
ncbi:MAG TPA: hypothetical protein VFN48_07190 [Solirubrobacteraceae bacterium]|nr:hypothetical protein [Solirubrobacteraceae bacterium]